MHRHICFKSIYILLSKLIVSIYVGLKRCGKSCRLRWLNYLKPDIKRGNISSDEEDLIIRLHKLLGNRYIYLYYTCISSIFFIFFLT